jgi:hypothetical protein
MTEGGLVKRLLFMLVSLILISACSSIEKGNECAEIVFIDFHLKDGSSIRTMYQSGSEVMNPGVQVGAELEKELKEVITKEWGIGSQDNRKTAQ